MNAFTLTKLKTLVERAVRPVRASTSRKRQMREELLAHVSAVFEEELARLADEQAALERTAQRFGNPTLLTEPLQESVPTLDSVERFADWVCFRPCESTLRRAVRYAVIFEVVPLLLVSAVLLLRARPTDVLSYTGPVLLSIGYLGFSVCILESSIRRLLGGQTRRSWLQFALVLVGSTLVSLTLGLWAFGVSPKKIFWVAFFTVGLPMVLSWGLAHAFAARKRYHDDWANLQIE